MVLVVNITPVMYSDITGYLPEWLETTLAAIGVALVVVAIVALAVSTVGIAGAGFMAVAFSTGFGAVKSGYSAYKEGTSIAAGIISGGIKGAAIGTAIGLGIMTGGGVFSGLGALGAFGTALGANFVGGMLSYTVDARMNGSNLEFDQSIKTGIIQTVSRAFAFASGFLIGASGFYNIPGQKISFTQYIGNTSAGLLFKGVYYYAIDAVLQMM